MSTEATVKKRGRPAAKAVFEAVSAPPPKARAKPAAKKSSVPNLPATSSITRPKPTKARKSVEEAAGRKDASVLDELELKVAPAVKKKVTAGKTVVSNSSTTSIGSSSTPCEKTTAPASKSSIFKARAASPISKAKGKPKDDALLLEPSVATTLPSESDFEALIQEGQALLVLKDPQPVSSEAVRRPISEILQQAQAFTRRSIEIDVSTTELFVQRTTTQISPALERRVLRAEVTSLGSPAPTVASEIQPTSSPQAGQLDTTNASLASRASTLDHLPPGPAPQEVMQASHPTTPINELSIASQPPPPPPATMPCPPPPSPKSPSLQTRAFSSTSPLPLSTHLALAARRPPASTLVRPSPAPPAPEVRGPPKLADLPYEQLKKNPRYRKASRRVGALFVAVPFTIVLSYMLWEKYQEHQFYLQKVRETKAVRQGPQGMVSSQSAPPSLSSKSDPLEGDRK